MPITLRPTPIALLIPLLFADLANGAELLALNTVQVTATRQAMRTNEVLSDVSVIERASLEQAGQSTLGDILARQPGVEFASSGSNGATGSLYMRGTSSGHTVVLIDGVRVGSASLGQMSSWSRIPVSQIERIEILRGPASSLYGNDAIGGVVQIFTRRGEGPLKFNAEVGAGTYDTQMETVGFSGGENGWHYAAQVAHNQTRGFNSVIKQNNSAYNPDRDNFSNTNFSGNLGYTLAKGHEVGASYFFSDGESGYDSTSPKTAVYRNQLAISTLSTFLKNAITENWTSTLRLGQSTDDSRNLKNGAQDSLFKTTQRQYTWQHDFKLPIGNLLFALERLDQSVTGTGRYPVEDRTIDSVLLGWNGQIGNHRLQINARNDSNSQFGDKTTGAVAYGYQLTQNWRANASLGTAFKAPSFNDLYYPLTFGYKGNPNLKPESSINQEAALHYDNGRHHVGLTVFQNRVSDLISWSGLTTPINIGEAKIQGATLSYEGKLADYDLNASYSHLDPRDRTTHHLLARRAQNYGSASLGKQLGAWEWRVEFQAQGQRFDTDANTRKLAGYALTNLYGAYQFERDWSVFARVNNVFDRNYELAADYATPGLNAFIGVRYAPK